MGVYESLCVKAALTYPRKYIRAYSERMKFIDPEPLDMAAQRILVEIENLSADAGDFTPDKLDRMARALTAQLKAIADIETHNGRVQKQDEEKNYLSYDDLPPPSPEERKRIIARVRLLYDRVTVGDGTSDISEHASRSPAGTSG